MELDNRFWSKVNKISHAPCWLWIAGKYSKGYGAFWFNGQRQYAHIVSYEAHKGPVPPGHDVHHTCELRACVNPDHLGVVKHTWHRSVYHKRSWNLPPA